MNRLMMILFCLTASTLTFARPLQVRGCPAQTKSLSDKIMFSKDSQGTLSITQYLDGQKKAVAKMGPDAQASLSPNLRFAHAGVVLATHVVPMARVAVTTGKTLLWGVLAGYSAVSGVMKENIGNGFSVTGQLARRELELCLKDISSNLKPGEKAFLSLDRRTQDDVLATLKEIAEDQEEHCEKTHVNSVARFGFSKETFTRSPAVSKKQKTLMR